jgi:hypothetical protein
MVSDAALKLLLAVFEVFDTLLVGDDDVGQAVHSVHDLAHAFVVLDLGGGDESHGLGERFMALGEPLQAIVDGHGRVASPVIMLLQAGAGSASGVRMRASIQPASRNARGDGVKTIL